MAVASDHLRLIIFPVDIVFSRDNESKIQSFELHSLGTGETTTYEAVEAVNPSPDELAAYTGTFYSDELLTHYVVILEDGKLILRHLRLKDEVLKPTFADHFELNFPQVKFERNAAGDIICFKIFTPRVRGIQFHRVESVSPLAIAEKD
jgi:hypothetical protein